MTKAMVRAHPAEIGATAASTDTNVDKLFYSIHTKATKTIRTFPYILMYSNQERGGVGLLQLLDTVSIDKLAELLRAH